MRLFIWLCEHGLTQQWHSGGAVVVLAESVEAARAMALAEYPRAAEELAGEPKSFDCAVAQSWMFQDAGCC